MSGGIFARKRRRESETEGSSENYFSRSPYRIASGPGTPLRKNEAARNGEGDDQIYILVDCRGPRLWRWNGCLAPHPRLRLVSKTPAEGGRGEAAAGPAALTIG